MAPTYAHFTEPLVPSRGRWGEDVAPPAQLAEEDLSWGGTGMQGRVLEGGEVRVSCQ